MGSWAPGRQGGKHGGSAHTLEGAIGFGETAIVAESTGRGTPLNTHPKPPGPQPWIPGLCAHRHGRTCSGGSTRCRDVGAGVALLPPSRKGGKGHSTLGRTPTGNSEQWAHGEARRQENETLQEL